MEQELKDYSEKIGKVNELFKLSFDKESMLEGLVEHVLNDPMTERKLMGLEQYYVRKDDFRVAETKFTQRTDFDMYKREINNSLTQFRNRFGEINVNEADFQI